MEPMHSVCQDRVMKRHVAKTRQCAGEVGAKAWPPLCIAAGYSPDKGKMEFASLAKIKTALFKTTCVIRKHEINMA